MVLVLVLVLTIKMMLTAKKLDFASTFQFHLVT